MSPSAAKLTEIPTFIFSYPARRPPFYLLLKPLSSIRRTTTAATKKNKVPSLNHGTSNSLPSHSSSWLNKWPHHVDPLSASTNPIYSDSQVRVLDQRTTTRGTAIERIVLRLRNLGLGSDDEEDEGDDRNEKDKLGGLLKRDWVRPDSMLSEGEDGTLLPWESSVELSDDEEEKVDGGRRVMVKEPTLAELTIKDEELRRLRRDGMSLREKINIPKAGVTGAVLEKIHQKWQKGELVRLKFHEALAHDMKTAHRIVERRTNGLVIWRSGSFMLVYRGNNYNGPSSRAKPKDLEDNDPVNNTNESINLAEGKIDPLYSIQHKTLTAKEAEFNKLLDGLGPRFEDWWGTGILPVDADLLPQTVPGYKTPFRLLPTRTRSSLTNAEMTNLRKLAKSLPCHFALGRNRHHQGLAASIIKLWEKSLVVKIAVKRGIQNTNNQLMSEELKKLTGGVLLLRNKYYIVIYRGKDFVPPSIANALAERQKMTKQILDVEEMVRKGPGTFIHVGISGEELITSDLAEQPEAKDVEDKQRSWQRAGSLAEFYEAQAQWGRRDVPHEERENMLKEAARARTERAIKRLEHKVAISQAKKLKAENLLSKIVASWVPVGPSDDQETITEEERAMYRQVGLKMKAFLPLGIRGVFDGVVENMHLHWKHRELVKLISKEKELAFVEETARLLEYESGGILVAIDRVPKGHSVIFYRGKNYRRPISLRPKNLLTKAKALKRRVALQQYEGLSQHIAELENTIEQTKRDIGVTQDVKGFNSNLEDGCQFNRFSELTQGVTQGVKGFNSNLEDGCQLNRFSELTQSGIEASWEESEGDEDPEWENEEDSDYSDTEFSATQSE
ncbi:unnamed protein product [Cuscuta epithymum]|uniref:CRM domain-containing protein n=1 Tax=Cuscuta epithymum TaxID=186058 RepID=A0AAV0G7G2_9ASTE|nr:unnamed protein product [Cuscuta epithymum]